MSFTMLYFINYNHNNYSRKYYIGNSNKTRNILLIVETTYYNIVYNNYRYHHNHVTYINDIYIVIILMVIRQ